MAQPNYQHVACKHRPMHPAFSIIFFTVMSGAGFGLAAVFAILQVTGLLDTLTVTGQLALLGVAVALVTVGLTSSTLHLANPKNAWRAVMRVRTSWLSREAVAAVAFYPIVGAYVLAIGYDAPGAWVKGLGLATALMAQLTVYTTSMIYASLKTMRAWHHPLVPVNYHLLSMASGAAVLVFLVALLAGENLVATTLAPLLLVSALLAKWLYYSWLDSGDSPGPTIQTATGLSRAAVRLLDLGHTADNFTTREFGFSVKRRVRRRARTVVLGGLTASTLLLSVQLVQSMVWLTATASLVTILSIFAERWLFFAEAKQAVMLYHGVDLETRSATRSQRLPKRLAPQVGTRLGSKLEEQAR